MPPDAWAPDAGEPDHLLPADDARPGPVLGGQEQRPVLSDGLYAAPGFEPGGDREMPD